MNLRSCCEVVCRRSGADLQDSIMHDSPQFFCEVVCRRSGALKQDLLSNRAWTSTAFEVAGTTCHFPVTSGPMFLRVCGWRGRAPQAEVKQKCLTCAVVARSCVDEASARDPGCPRRVKEYLATAGNARGKFQDHVSEYLPRFNA